MVSVAKVVSVPAPLHTQTHTCALFTAQAAPEAAAMEEAKVEEAAALSRLLKITGLFCKRDLQKRLYSVKPTYAFKESTNRSHPIADAAPEAAVEEAKTDEAAAPAPEPAAPAAEDAAPAADATPAADAAAPEAAAPAAEEATPTPEEAAPAPETPTAEALTGVYMCVFGSPAPPTAPALAPHADEWYVVLRFVVVCVCIVSVCVCFLARCCVGFVCRGWAHPKHCNTLPNTATPCNTLQHTTTHWGCHAHLQHNYKALQHSSCTCDAPLRRSGRA